jgi:hypothetical protein
MFRPLFGILLLWAGAIMVGISIALRYAAWAAGAVTNAMYWPGMNAMQYWVGITLSDSGLWLAMFIVGLCIVIADHHDDSSTPKAAPEGVQYGKPVDNADKARPDWIIIGRRH